MGLIEATWGYHTRELCILHTVPSLLSTLTVFWRSFLISIRLNWYILIEHCYKNVKSLLKVSQWMFNTSQRVSTTTQGAVEVSPTVAWRQSTRRTISRALWEGSEGLTCDNITNSSQSSKNHSEIEKCGQGSLTDLGHSSVVKNLSRMHDTLGSVPRATLSSLCLMLCEYMFLKTRPAVHVCIHGKIKKKMLNELCGQNELSHQISKLFKSGFEKEKLLLEYFPTLS